MNQVLSIFIVFYVKFPIENDLFQNGEIIITIGKNLMYLALSSAVPHTGARITLHGRFSSLISFFS